MDKKLKINNYIVIAKDCDKESIQEIKDAAKKAISFLEENKKDLCKGK